jgi:hypothetical protein
MRWFENGDRDPWERRVVYNERADEWTHTYAPILVVSAPVNGGDECTIYNPDPEAYLNEWCKTDLWYDLCDCQ